MTTRKEVEHLYSALAAILNALDEAGEMVRPWTDAKTKYSAVLGENGRVEADSHGKEWISVMQPED